ncbi:unnamed protein product [Brachionus calyciflorus]|uniref:Uncharacterized protein n=1 Tax=Brachionus calyciflorus TaxID=104777 RepID=A0A814NAH0_9BILA|nr:unnamed protein product [Brachionus calyciflorus]
MSKLPSVIVVDFSWAMINSILEAFNSCSMRNYLYLSYDIMILKKNKEKAFLNCLMSTKVYLCSTHFLKLIISKAEKIKPQNEIKRIFIFGFTLLQNSTSLQEFENNLIDLYSIFNEQFESISTSDSLKRLEKNVRTRNLNNDDIDRLITGFETDSSEIDKIEFEDVLNENDKQTLKSSS